MLQPHSRTVAGLPARQHLDLRAHANARGGFGPTARGGAEARPPLEHKPATPCVQPAAPYTSLQPHAPTIQPHTSRLQPCVPPQVYNSLAQPLDAVVELPISAASLKLVAGPAAAGPTSVQAEYSPACYGAATLCVRSCSPAC